MTHVHPPVAHTARRQRSLGLTLCQLAVPALAIPSAIGVAKFFRVADGAAHWSLQGVIAAVGFELMNVGLSVLDIRHPELHPTVHRVRFWSVTTAIALNVIAHYGERVPGLDRLDAVGGLLALVASIPLAVLYVALAGLLHAIGERDHAAADDRAHRVAELATARAELAAATERLAQAEAQTADAVARAGQAEATAAQVRREAETRVAQQHSELAALRQSLARAEHEMAQVRRELAHMHHRDGEEWITYNGQRFTLAQLVTATGTSSGTLRRKLAQVTGTTAHAAD
jgi:uncharacterized coiled-coil protein SlyX